MFYYILQQNKYNLKNVNLKKKKIICNAVIKYERVIVLAKLMNQIKLIDCPSIFKK